MGGVSFKMDMDKLMRGMDVAMHKAQRSHELMNTIGETLKSSTQQRFKEGVDPDGKKWRPSQRVIKDGGQTLLKSVSGGLRDSVSYEATPQMVVVGSNKIYARIHQLGGKAGLGRKVTIPERPYLGINDEDRAEIKALMVAELKSMFGA